MANLNLLCWPLFLFIVECFYVFYSVSWLIFFEFFQELLLFYVKKSLFK